MRGTYINQGSLFSLFQENSLDFDSSSSQQVFFIWKDMELLYTQIERRVDT